MKTCKLGSDDSPEKYIPIAYGTEAELNELAGKLFAQLDLIIITSPSGVCTLAIIYELGIRFTS